MNTTKLPIEVGLEKAKFEILQAINQIGRSYELPSALTTMIIEQILLESRLNTFQTIVTHYDINIPKGVDQSSNSKVSAPLVNDDIITDMTKPQTKQEEPDTKSKEDKK